MSVIEELADICLRQAGIIKAQAEVLEQLGAQALEDEALAARLQTLVGDVNMAEYRRLYKAAGFFRLKVGGNAIDWIGGVQGRVRQHHGT